MTNDCIHSHCLDNKEGLPIVKCDVKMSPNSKYFLDIKEDYNRLNRGNACYNDDCEFAYLDDGQKECRYYKPRHK